MGLSPKSPTSIQESTSGSLELQPFNNLDDSSSLQVQDVMSALYDCELEKVRLHTVFHDRQKLLEKIDRRLKRADEDVRMQAMRLMACVEEMEEEERYSDTIKGAAETLSGNVMRSRRAVRNQETEVRRESSRLDSRLIETIGSLYDKKMVKMLSLVSRNKDKKAE